MSPALNGAVSLWCSWTKQRQYRPVPSLATRMHALLSMYVQANFSSWSSSVGAAPEDRKTGRET